MKAKNEVRFGSGLSSARTKEIAVYRSRKMSYINGN